MAMCVPIILFFMAFMYALWLLSVTEHASLSAGHYATSLKSTGFLSMQQLEQGPEGAAADEAPQPVNLPALPGVTDLTLLGYESFPNMAAYAAGSRYLRTVGGLGIEFGGFSIVSDGIVIRPSWTFDGCPTVNTQHASEAAEIREWYFDARDATLPQSVRNNLGIRGSSTMP